MIMCRTFAIILALTPIQQQLYSKEHKDYWHLARLLLERELVLQACGKGIHWKHPITISKT